ncbi:acyltransferase family protein, partial [Vibrio parahaemolyticus]|uniref:acyltransferase family protein n=1 Tax=Vibrio parahaemolyticus TaxID=670 RepID=UPI00356B6412
MYHGNDFDNSILFRMIYSFHMPFFMFIAGYLNCSSSEFNIKDKFKLLLIPFFSWGIVDFLITDKGMSFIGFIVDLVENPDKGLWFLWVLFFIMLSHAGLSK